MVHTCAVAGCPNRWRQKSDCGFGNVSFHLFPLNDEDLCKKWSAAIGREGFTPNKYSAVCSLHFKDSDINVFHDDNNSTRRKCQVGVRLKRRYLRKDAVPCMHLSVPSQLRGETSIAVPNDIEKFVNAKAEKCALPTELVVPKLEVGQNEMLEDEQYASEVSLLSSNIDFEERAPIINHAACESEMNFRQRLLQFQKDGYLCDLVLVADDGEVKVHGVVLAAASNRFHGTLKSQTTQAEQAIVVPGYNVKMLNIAIHYIYTGHVIVPDSYKQSHCMQKVASMFLQLGIKWPSSSAYREASLKRSQSVMSTVDDVSYIEDEAIVVQPTTFDLPSNDDETAGTFMKRAFVSENGDVSRRTGVGKKASEASVTHSGPTDSVEVMTDGDDNLTDTDVCAESDSNAGAVTEPTASLQKEEEAEEEADNQIGGQLRGKPTKRKAIGERLYSCQYCSKRFAYRQSLLSHTSKRHRDDVIDSAIDVKSAESTSSTYSCSQNGAAEFTSRHDDLQRHDETSSGRTEAKHQSRNSTRRRRRNVDSKRSVELPHSCETCQQKFSSELALAIHLHKHADSATWRCTICSKEFDQLLMLRRHMTSDHCATTPHVCEFCGQHYLTAVTLDVHRRTFHTGEGLHRCDTCGKTYPSRWYLVEHQRLHTGEKPFHCKTCDRWLRTSKELKYHDRVHSAKLEHMCEMCGKAFRDREDFVHHVRTHTGETPFECTVCHRKFRHALLVHLHMQTHSSEKPFGCERCDKAYKTRHDLRKHMRRVHQMELPLQSRPRVARVDVAQPAAVSTTMTTDETAGGEGQLQSTALSVIVSPRGQSSQPVQ